MMIKKRIIGVVLIKDGIAVQSIEFKRFLPIGSPGVVIQYLDRWGIDEIIVLHIDATINSSKPSIDNIKAYAKLCQVPLAIGGGINHINDVKELIQAGADKIVLNTNAILQPELVTKASELCGSQSVVVALDVRKVEKEYLVYTHSGSRFSGFTVQQLVKKLVHYGAGEMMITSIDRDGRKTGYDLELIELVTQELNVPIIACGGVGNPQHLKEALKFGVSGLAVGNFFHFTEHCVTKTKQYLKSRGEKIRLDSHITYDHSNINDQGRLLKNTDENLESLRFEYIEVEAI